MSDPQTTFDLPEEAYIAIIDLARIGTAIAVAREIHHPVGKEILKLLYPIQEALHGAIKVKA